MCELGNQQAVLCSACHLLYVNVTFCPLSFHLLHPYQAQEVLHECTRINASIFNCTEQLELCDQEGVRILIAAISHLPLHSFTSFITFEWRKKND